MTAMTITTTPMMPDQIQIAGGLRCVRVIVSSSASWRSASSELDSALVGAPNSIVASSGWRCTGTRPDAATSTSARNSAAVW